MFSNVYDDVKDFEVCGFNKNKKSIIYLANEALFFVRIKKFIHFKLSYKWQK